MTRSLRIAAASWGSPLLLIVAFGILLTLPLLVHGFWPYTWDARLHINWSINFSRQFWAGELYPRWLSGMNEGLGSPVFFYYPPTPYWVTSFLQPLTGNDPLGWRPLAWSCCLGLILSGVSCFVWLRRLTPQWPALTAALLYMLMPYHLRTDLYVRGAFAEFWSFAWMPLILHAVHRVSAKERFALPYLGFAYALLITTHLPTTLIFSLVPVAYACLVNWSGQSAWPVVRTAAGMALGIGLASIYLIPAMTMQGHASMQELTTFLYYSKSFFLAEFDWRTRSLGDVFKTQMFWVMLATVAAGCCSLLLVLRSSARHLRRQACFWLVVMLMAYFMMFTISDPVWRLVSAIQIIQFPWRFGAVLCVAVAALMALAMASLSRPLRWPQLALLQGGYTTVIVWIFLTVVALWPTFFYPKESRLTARASTVDPPEYRPFWVQTNRDQVIEKYASSPLATNRVVFSQGTGSVSVMAWEPRNIRLQVTASTNATLQFHRFFYAGWEAYSGSAQIHVSPTHPEGLLSTTLPAGQHDLVLVMKATKPEAAARSLSAAAVLLWLCLLGLELWPSKTSKPLPNTAIDSQPACPA